MLGTILVTVALGAFVGWLASLVTKRDAEQGWVANIVVGVIGALVASFILNGGNSDAWISFDFWDVVAAFLGAVAVCVIINLATRKRIV